MSLRNQLEEYSESIEDKDESPVSVTVSETDEDGLELNSTWMEERERTSLLAETEDGEPETDVLPSTYYNSIEDADLIAELSEVFADVKSVVSVSESWTAHPFSFSTLSEHDGESELENPFAPDWADYGAMAFITNEQETVSESGNQILELVVTELTEVDSKISMSDLNTVEMNFSDWNECHLQSVHVYVETAHPHRFYENVDGVDEYVEAVADSEEEEAELRAEEKHEVFVRLDDPSGDGSEIDSELVSTVESVMADRVTSAVDSEVEWFYESQSIVFTPNSDVAEQTSFYLRVPFCSEK